MAAEDGLAAAAARRPGGFTALARRRGGVGCAGCPTCGPPRSSSSSAAAGGGPGATGRHPCWVCAIHETADNVPEPTFYRHLLNALEDGALEAALRSTRTRCLLAASLAAALFACLPVAGAESLHSLTYATTGLELDLLGRGAAVALLATLLLNAVLTPNNQDPSLPAHSAAPIAPATAAEDKKHAALLSGAIRCKTISYDDSAEIVRCYPTASSSPALRAHAVSHALRCATCCWPVARMPQDYSEFEKLHRYLETSFPLVHKHLAKSVINNHSLLYEWKGSDSSLQP